MEALLQSRVSATFILHSNCLRKIICDSPWIDLYMYLKQEAYF